MDDPQEPTAEEAPEPVETAPPAESLPKTPLDCPLCILPINHAGDHIA